MFDDLEQFKIWWMGKRPINTPKENCLSHVAETHGVVLYRQKPYQVELFNVKPNSEIPLHIHPNVDSYEVYLGGDVEFICNDKHHKQHDIGGSIRVLPNSYHGGKFGEKGGCFLSIQKWLNEEEPRFIGKDWADKSNNNSYEESRK